jgi:MFS family permease
MLRYLAPGYRRRMRRLFALVAAVIVLDTMFYAALAPLLPEYADDLGLSKSGAGVLSAAYAAGTLVAALPSGWLAARLGVRRTMLIGLGLLGSSSLAFAFGESAAVLDVARFAQGVGGACAWAGGLTWLLMSVPRHRRGQLIGAALAAAVGGILLGPVLGGIATLVDPEPVFVGVAVIAGALAALVLSASGAPRSQVPAAGEVARTIFTPGVLVAFWLVVLPSVLSGTIDVLVPLKLGDLGASGIGIGAVFLIAAAIEATISPAIGRLSDRRGRWSPIRAGLVASTVAAFALAPLEAIVVIGIAVVATFLAMSLIWTPAMALLSDEAEGAGLNLAFAAALVNLAWAGGHVIGGSALPHLAESTSDATAYLLVATLFALTAAALLAVRRTA